jgi:hypothetical protein
MRVQFWVWAWKMPIVGLIYISDVHRSDKKQRASTEGKLPKALPKIGAPLHFLPHWIWIMYTSEQSLATCIFAGQPLGWAMSLEKRMYFPSRLMEPCGCAQ